MPTLHSLGISASITVDGMLLEEYGTTVSEEKRVTCYIASQAGQQFQISMENKTFSYLGFYANLDGFDSGGNLINPGRVGVKKGLVLSETSTKPYAFSKIELTDDDRVLASTRKMSETLGVIEIKVYRVIRGAPMPISAKSTEMDNQPVHERSKKAGGHRISLGAPFHHSPASSVAVHQLDPTDNPYGIFRFIYRPLGLLQAQGIAPQGRGENLTPVAPSISQASSSSSQAGPSSTANQKSKRKIDNDPTEGHTSARKRRETDTPKVTSPVRIKPEETDDFEKRAKLEGMKKQLEQLQAEIDLTEADLNVKREMSPIRVPPPPPGKKRVVIDLTL